MIPFVDLKAQYLSIQNEVDAAIKGVLNSCQFTLGEEVVCFEREFAQYCQASLGVAVNTGTSALHLALLAAGVGPGDEVITVPFTFVATVAAIEYTGAKPVLVDIQPDTLTMDPAAFEAAITPRTKAVIPVHLYGLPADMEAIGDVAKRHKLVVIEDAAQAHGAEILGQRVGSWGDMACFSFYPGKNLGAYGEGGMVVTDNEQWAHKIRMLRDWGAEKKYQHEIKGYNFRMEGIQGAVLRVKLRHLERWTEQRRMLALQYDEVMQEVDVKRQLTPAGRRHVYHVYAIRCAQRLDWQRRLLEQGIQTGIHYPTPVHMQPAYTDLGYVAGDFPHSERAASEVLSLPMFPELTPVQCETVAQAVAKLAASNTQAMSVPQATVAAQ